MSVVFVRKPLPGINEKGKSSMNTSCECQLKTAVDLEEKLSKLHESSS